MIVGFNHNVLYRGVGFHVQTEDSGLKSPSLVTLLYHGGIIVSSQKTSYADILGIDNLSHVVEELAKEQHKGMLRRLTKGDFDQRISELGIEIEACQSAKMGATPLVDKQDLIENNERPRRKQRGINSLQPLLNRVASYGELDPIEKIKNTIDAAAVEPLPVDELAGDDGSFYNAGRGATFPLAIEPAYEPLGAADRSPHQDISGALDDLIFSYLTGGNKKS